MAHYLVTGGAGFIGSNLVDRLLDRGHRVRVLDDFSSGRRENLRHARDRIELVEGSICDPDLCARACDGVDIAFHHAAQVSVPASVTAPAATHRVNVDGTFNMLRAAREAGVRRFVHAGSSSVYGEREELSLREDALPAPVSPYGATKAIGEIYCRAFSAAFGLETVTLRYFNVFGPRQDPASPYAAAIPAFLRRMLRGERPIVYGDGGQSRDFTYVENVLEANLKAAEAPELGGEVVNVACGEAVTVNRVIARMNELLGTDFQPRYDSPRPGDVRHSRADLSRARDVIGYEPRVGFAEGLEKALAWYRENL